MNLLDYKYNSSKYFVEPLNFNIIANYFKFIIKHQ